MAIKSIRERREAQKKKILQKWEEAGKPKGEALEKWVKEISDKDVDKKFDIVFNILWWLVIIFFFVLVLINDESVTWESFFDGLIQFLIRGGVTALVLGWLSTFSEDTWKILGSIALIVAIIGIAIAVGGAIGGIAGVIVAIIILKFFDVL